MTAYYLALALDRASPQRKDVAAKAIEQLTQFDNPESNVQTAVRLALAVSSSTRPFSNWAAVATPPAF